MFNRLLSDKIKAQHWFDVIFQVWFYTRQFDSLICQKCVKVFLEWDRWYRAVFTWLSKVIGFGFGFGFGFTTPFGWLVYLLWFWFYDSQVKTTYNFISNVDNNFQTFYVTYMIYLKREL